MFPLTEKIMLLSEVLINLGGFCVNYIRGGKRRNIDRNGHVFGVRGDYEKDE